MTWQPRASGVELRPLRADEMPTALQLLSAAFLHDARPDEEELERTVFEADRSIGAFDPDLVGTAMAYTRQLTVPGGPVPVAGVSWVGVAPTRRRRGVLSAMMRHQLSSLYEEGREAVAALWASEPAIYGRYGYGLAARRGPVTVSTREARLLPEVDRGTGRLVPSSPEEARKILAEVYERVRGQQIGLLDRPGHWWDKRLADPAPARRGFSALRCVRYENGDGVAEGYVLFATKASWSDVGPAGETAVRELIAASPQAYAALWGLLIEMDLVRKVSSDMTAVDEPLGNLVDNPRALHQQISDALWVRLVDLPRALAGRRYRVPVDVVLQIDDPVCPWNTGTVRLSGGPDGAVCEPSTATPDIGMSSRTLAATYLGGTTLIGLAHAGLVAEFTPGALARASTAFAADRQAHCPEVF